MASGNYQLSVEVKGRWLKVAVIGARSSKEALRRAIACLKPEHYDKPIRVEKFEEP